MTALRSVVPDEAEAALWSAFVAHRSADARLVLFDRYAPMARGIAARHYRRDVLVPIAFPELIQLAYVGLLEAIDRFKPELEVPFRYFAGRRIAGSVIDGIASHCEINRQISHQHKRARERFASIAADEPKDGLDLDDTLDLLGQLVEGLALGFMLDDAAQTDVGAKDAPDAFETLAWRQATDLLRRQVDQLPEREAFIIRLHYLDGLPFDRIAVMLDLSKGRISQLHRDAILRLGKRLGTSMRPAGPARGPTR